MPAFDRPTLEAVLLDAGGTIIRLDYEWMSELLIEMGIAASPGALKRAEVDGRRRYDAFRAARRLDDPPAPDAVHARAYFGGMLEAMKVGEPHSAMVLERFVARQSEVGLWARPMEGAREALEGLEQLGVRRVVVSNSDGRADEHLRACGFGNEFEFIVDSAIVGVEKPDPRIFTLALERLGVAPERAVYVGDMVAVDHAGARAAGLRAVILDPFGDYAGDGIERMASIAELPMWIAANFDVVARPASDSRRAAAPAHGQETNR